MDREDGVALIYVLFATVIISGLIVVFMSRILFETRSTAQARDYEAAVHVAEAGAEELFGTINREDETNKHVTSGPSGDHVFDDPADERQWAVDLALDDTADMVETEYGQAYGIRPEDSSGQVLDTVYGVGFVPSADAANREIRVVKMQIARRYYSPDHAMLAGGDLDLGGNAEILAPGCDTDDPETCNANVHANGNVAVSGTSHRIQGDLTTSGTISGTPVTEGGDSTAGEAQQEPPPVRARDFYDRDTTYNSDPQTGESVQWHDLCDDGVIREPAATPCTGDVIWPTGDGSTSYLGWSFQSGTGTWRATDVEAGIFYVHHADATVRGSAGDGQRAVSILVETDDSRPAATGSLELSGNPDLVSALPDTLFVADRDLKLKGTSNGGQEECDPDIEGDCDDEQSYTGFLFAREQVDVSGTVTLEGAIVAEDDEDLHGLVSRNTAGISGTMTLTYDDNLKVDLRGRVTVEFWNELR